MTQIVDITPDARVLSVDEMEVLLSLLDRVRAEASSADAAAIKSAARIALRIGGQEKSKS